MSIFGLCCSFYQSRNNRKNTIQLGGVQPGNVLNIPFFFYRIFQLLTFGANALKYFSVQTLNFAFKDKYIYICVFKVG